MLSFCERQSRRSVEVYRVGICYPPPPLNRLRRIRHATITDRDRLEERPPLTVTKSKKDHYRPPLTVTDSCHGTLNKIVPVSETIIKQLENMSDKLLRQL